MPYSLHSAGKGTVPPDVEGTESNTCCRHGSQVLGVGFELSLYCLTWIFSSAHFSLLPFHSDHPLPITDKASCQELAFLPERLLDTTSNPPASCELVRVLQTSGLVYPSTSPLSSSLPGFKFWPGQRRGQSVGTLGFSSLPRLC